jgi:hypothetical protein
MAGGAGNLISPLHITDDEYIYPLGFSSETKRKIKCPSLLDFNELLLAKMI